MKYRLLLPLILLCNIVFGQFPIGANPGYYANATTGATQYPLDTGIYSLMVKSGCAFTRSTVDIKSAQTYGYATFTSRFAYMYNVLGLRNNILFATVTPGNGTYTGQSTAITSGGNRSTLPSGLKLQVFNSDSSINQANIWAYYIYNLVTTYGAYFSKIQIFNEPDLTGSPNAYLDSTQSATSWEKVEPIPDNFQNMYDSLENYVLMCHIARLVCNKYAPTMKILAGGVGYSWFWMWCIRKGISPNIDILDFHEYPSYQWTYCVWNGATASCGTVNGDNGAHRNSDVAANLVDSVMRQFRFIETQEGATHIPFGTTETALPRWSFPLNTSSQPFPNNKNFGSNDVQQNFIIKSAIICMRDTLQYYTMYQTGEAAQQNDASSGNLFVAMGLYHDLDSNGVVGHETKTPQGVSYTVMQNLLKNYKINLTAPTLTAGTNGAELDSSTFKTYVVWAICTHDTVESAVGTFNLPAGQTYTEFDRNGNLISSTVTGTVSLSGAPIFLRQNTGGNAPPTVSAGSNQTISATSTTLTGTASAGSGSITSSTWTQISGANTATITTPSSLTTTVIGMITGTYVFQLSVTNSNSLTTTSRVTVTVSIAPLAPTAAITTSASLVTLPLDSVTLNGAGSHDNNNGGTISSYSWSQISGAASTIRTRSGASTIVVMPTAGTYGYQLIVVNSGGVSSAPTTINITVNPASLSPITAKIAVGQNVITLPFTTVVLNGTGSQEPNPSSTITTWQWSIINTPAGSGATLQNPTSNITNLVNVVPGTYKVQLFIRDNNGLTSTATQTITVNSNQIITNKIVKSVH